MLLTIALLSLSAAGCSNLLEGSTEIVQAHEITPFVRPPVELPSVSSLDEFEQLLMEMIINHEEETTVQYLGIDSEDITTDAALIPGDIMSTNPVAAYAVTDITVTTTVRGVSSPEITINIGYRRTLEQVQSRVSVSTQRNMITPLLDAMSRYRTEAVFLTDMYLDKDDASDLVTDIYYQNPRRIVMMPIVTLEVFPPPDDETEDTFKIYEIKFGYTITEDAEMLRSMGENLDTSVRRNAARAEGTSDAEIILSLVENLIASAVYEEGMAGTIAMHGSQNIAATAYGALVQGSAVGEGFAMAFKALCDELRLDCSVVLGAIDDKYHAWNIIRLEGNYYHIDTAMCADKGLEAGFLKTDEDMEALFYTWDTGITPACNGPLTLADLLPPPIEDEPIGVEEEETDNDN